MKLRYSPTSPYVRKVMVVGLETGLAERIERIPTTVVPTRPNEEVARENPLVKVPALTTDDGLVLYDSPVICEYLDTLHSGAKLFPAGGKARWLALRQQALGDGILDAAILGRYEILRPKEYQWPDWMDAQMRKVRGALAALEIEVEAGELGGPLTIGQITIACALGYLDFRYASEGWRTRHRRLAAWCDEFSKRKSIELTIPRDPTPA
jgi:glutathione S-transferase